MILSPLQYNILCNREKKLLHHIAMVAKFLDLNNHGPSNMAAMLISALMHLLADEPKLINWGEDHYTFLLNMLSCLNREFKMSLWQRHREHQKSNRSG